MDMVTLLIIVLILAVIGALPQWPYTRRYEWGYWPSSLLLVVILILIIFLVAPGAWRFPTR